MKSVRAGEDARLSTTNALNIERLLNAQGAENGRRESRDCEERALKTVKKATFLATPKFRATPKAEGYREKRGDAAGAASP